MEGKHLHGDEWSHHIRKWKKKKQSLAWTSPYFSLDKLHEKQTAQFTNVFSPYAFCLLYIKENQWIISRKFHPPQINWMWICYFSTNDTTYRRNSAMKSSWGTWQVVAEAESCETCFWRQRWKQKLVTWRTLYTEAEFSGEPGCPCQASLLTHLTWNLSKSGNCFWLLSVASESVILLVLLCALWNL